MVVCRLYWKHTRHLHNDFLFEYNGGQHVSSTYVRAHNRWSNLQYTVHDTTHDYTTRSAVMQASASSSSRGDQSILHHSEHQTPQGRLYSVPQASECDQDLQLRCSTALADPAQLLLCSMHRLCQARGISLANSAK